MGVDLVGPIVRSTGGNKYILVVICHFTNWIEAIPLKTLTAEEAIRSFFKAIVSRHGCPHQALTDLGTNFSSGIFENLCRAFGIKHLKSSAYHHQCNGKVERFIRFLKNSLGTVVNDSQKNWDEMLDNVLFVYRISYSRSLEDSPFVLLYGRDPILPQDLKMGLHLKQKKYGDTDLYKIELLRTLAKAYNKVKETKEKNQREYKRYYDRSHRTVSYKEGDKVWIHFWLPEKDKTHKLLARFEGPFEIKEQMDAVSYRVANERRTFIVHVQRILPYYVWDNQ